MARRYRRLYWVDVDVDVDGVKVDGWEYDDDNDECSAAMEPERRLTWMHSPEPKPQLKIVVCPAWL